MPQNLTEFNCRGISVIAYPASSVYVVVQFYPCFTFYFPLFQTHYQTRQRNENLSLLIKYCQNNLSRECH